MKEYSNEYFDNISKRSLNNNYTNLSHNSNHSSIKANLLIEYENLSSNFQNDLNNNNNNITSNYNDIENEDYNNDLSSDDEYDNKLSEIKKGVLNVKLNIFINIIQSNLSKKFIFFISKMNYKAKCNKLFLADDNFLYFKLNSKLSDIYKLYAYKKILYVVRKHSYEKFIKNCYLNLWKNNATKNIYKNNIRKNEINTAEFCSKIIHIINNRFERDYTYKYYINKWNILLEYSEIKKNNLTKAIFILSNLFNRKIRYFFKKFPKNFLYINSKSKLIKKINDDNNNEIVNEIIKNENIFYHKGLRDFYDNKKKYKDLLKQNKLLNLIKKYDIKNCINKNILIFFKILKTSTKSYKKKYDGYNKMKNMLMDLKIDTMLNATIMLKIILFAKIKNDILPYKRIFLTKIYCFNKWINLFNYYNKNYLNIEQIINYNCTNKKEVNNIKGEINFIRNIYQRAFALEKILIINNKHRFFYSDLNIRLRKNLLKKYFNLWRNITFSSYKNEKELKINAIKGIYFILNEILINKDKKYFYYYLKKIFLNTIYSNKIKNCAVIYLCQCIKYFIYNKNNNFIFRTIQTFVLKNNNINRINTTSDNSYIFYITSKKLYFIYKKKIDILKYNYFIKWRNKAHILSLNNDISKKKKYFLYKFIYSKKFNLLFYYFKKWCKITLKNKQQNQIINYDNLITELNQLRKENDELIAIYYKRKQEYAKTIYDYQYMKNYYCEKCINENDIEIDYLSIKSKDIKEAGLLFANSNSLNISRNKINNKEEDNKSKRVGSFGNNFKVNEENKLQSNNSSIMSLSENDDMNSKYGRKLPQCTTGTIFTKNMLNMGVKNEEKRDEGLIKEYQDEFNEQQKYYENYIKILMDKKNELLQMKNMLKNQKKGK